MMSGVILFFSSLFMGLVSAQSASSRLVTISQGPVRGYRIPNANIFAFYNIPYASVTERFKAPSAPPTWTQPFEAVDRGIICPQFEVGLYDLTKKTMQEDCLVVNVFVPDTDEDNLPVLVSVHGGAFQIGFGNSQSFLNLSEKNKVITVNFNYRLGILGFLCLGTKSAPGNAGLKDQVALLRWVKTNIAKFGGNPNDVTISGCSAGSASIDLLTTSTAAKGLFNRAIMDSGAGVGAFAVPVDPLGNAKITARDFNVAEYENINVLEEFYRNAPVKTLTSRSFMGNRHTSVDFSPCVERETGEEIILSDAPFNSLSSGGGQSYPMIYGFADMEGIMRLPSFFRWVDEMNQDLSPFLPGDLYFESEEQKRQVAQKVKEFYFGEEPVSLATASSYVDYFTDVMFAFPMLKAVKLRNENGNPIIYLYEYSFVDNDFKIPYFNLSGADHCTQTMAVRDEDESNITAEYRKIKAIMREIWGNFIKTGNPVSETSSLPPWPIANAERSPHMSIGQVVELKDSLLESRIRFWDEIYSQYYRIPAPPNVPGSSGQHGISYFVFICILLISGYFNFYV